MKDYGGLDSSCAAWYSLNTMANAMRVDYTLGDITEEVLRITDSNERMLWCLKKTMRDAEHARTGCGDRAEFMVALEDIVMIVENTLGKVGEL